MKKRILIIDDDPAYVSFLNGVLKRANFDTVCVSDGLHALNILHESKVDLMLIDIMMPDLNGYETIWVLRHHEKYTSHHQVPMIALTSLAGSVVKARLKEIEADAWIQKPVSPKRLVEIIEQFLSVPVQESIQKGK